MGHAHLKDDFMKQRYFLITSVGVTIRPLKNYLGVQAVERHYDYLKN